MLIEETLASGMRVWHARPDTREPRPLMLMLHERYGPVQHSFNVIERIAEAGFVACFMDMFHRYEGDRAPIEKSEARVDPTDEESVADLDETIAHMRTLGYVDGGRIGVVGFCLSGRTPLVYAAARGGVSAIAVFHGGVYPRDYAGSTAGQEPVSNVIPKLPCPVLGMFGELDPLVPLENVQRFRRDLERARKHYRIRVYAGTPHGWQNSTMPDHYRPGPADAAWGETVDFFNEVFAGRWDDGRLRWQFEPDAAVTYDFSA
ncbi:MAG: dienelactone hydrolase family protein [Chloroflexi bacterium]|nr:dienelactone hydrolase family protein [Chloroflexota bacterium]